MIHAIIMAGGKGTRFWPLSRAVKAKQFLQIIGNRTLLEHTISRLHPLTKKENTWIVGNHAQKKFFASLKGTVPTQQILLEPCGRNTAPCIGWAALEAFNKDPDATMIVLPADHFIDDTKRFRQTLKAATDHIAKHPDRLVTIGIQPTFPHTGYGYIQAEDNQEITKVRAFKEKPDTKTAQEYINSKTFFWNAGIFIWKAATILDLIKTHLPTIYNGLQEITTLNNQKLSAKSHTEALSKIYHALESISVDYGILEHASDKIDMIHANFDWNDIGNWPALEDFWPKDAHQNAAKGELISLNSHRNLVHSPHKIVALIDMDDIIVIDTEDALLIAPKSSDQKIKHLYDELPGHLQ